MKRDPRLWLLLFVVVAAALRLPTVGRESLWLDEAISYLAAGLPSRAIAANTVQSSHPPLYYLALSGWRALAPDSDGALRLLGVLWSLLLIPALYGLGRALFASRRAGLVAAGLAAISPFHLLYSHELRMYTQLMLLATLTVWAYWRARARSRARWADWLLFAGLAVAAIYTHLFAGLVLVAIGLHALVRREKSRALWATIGVGVLVVLFFLPWLLRVFGEADPALGSLRPLEQANVFNPVKPLTTPTFLLFGLSTRAVYSGLALFLTLSLAAVLAIDLRHSWKGGHAAGTGLPLLIVATTLGVPLVVYMARPFFLPERTLAAASPFMLLLLAWGVTRRRGPLPYLVAAAAGVMLGGSLLLLAEPAGKPPYRDVMAAVAAEHTPGDLVLHTSDGSYLPALRYFNLPRHAVLAGDPDPRKPVAVYEALGGAVWSADALPAGERLWLIVALEHSFAWQEAQAAAFGDRYPLQDKFTIGGIDIYRYDLTERP